MRWSAAWMKSDFWAFSGEAGRGDATLLVGSAAYCVGGFGPVLVRKVARARRMAARLPVSALRSMLSGGPQAGDELCFELFGPRLPGPGQGQMLVHPGGEA